MRKRFLGLFVIMLILFAFSVPAESVEVVAFQGSFGINFKDKDYIRNGQIIRRQIRRPPLI